jgi:hypothetical protein
MYVIRIMYGTNEYQITYGMMVRGGLSILFPALSCQVNCLPASATLAWRVSRVQIAAAR